MLLSLLQAIRATRRSRPARRSAESARDLQIRPASAKSTKRAILYARDAEEALKSQCFYALTARM